MRGTEISCGFRILSKNRKFLVIVYIIILLSKFYARLL